MFQNKIIYFIKALETLEQHISINYNITFLANFLSEFQSQEEEYSSKNHMRDCPS